MTVIKQEEKKEKQVYKRDLNVTKVLRMKELPDVVGAKPSTIYTWIREGHFPAPKKMQRISICDKDVVENWVAEKLAS